MLNELPIVLIADDEPNICRIAKLIIPDNEFQVITAENGMDAYEKALQHQPDIIFSDILMPKCDGFEFCQKIKQNDVTANIPFIFLTGVDEAQCKARMDEVHADDFLSKPFSSKIMIEKIKTYVKPILNTEISDIRIKPKINLEFKFGIANIDQQLYGHIYPQSFIMIQGPIGSGKSNLTRQFITDGIANQQRSLLLSFETPKEKLDPIFKLSNQDETFLTFCDASRWTSIDSKPWRNIDYIYDYLSEACAKQSYQRIVIDSFSHGFAFWSQTDILKFVDLCRSLPNNEQQCVLWTINQHPTIDTLIYHLNHVMDIGIETTFDGQNFKSDVTYSKWQSFNSKIIEANQIQTTQTTTH
ncbi:MAG: response regulator [Candidatus Margulisiibacteriota bacterium]